MAIEDFINLKLYDQFREVMERVSQHTPDDEFATRARGSVTVEFDGIILVSVIGSMDLCVRGLKEAFEFIIPRAVQSSYVQVRFLPQSPILSADEMVDLGKKR